MGSIFAPHVKCVGQIANPAKNRVMSFPAKNTRSTTALEGSVVLYLY